MLLKIRENIFLGDGNLTAKELKENAITMILVVDDQIKLGQVGDVDIHSVDLHTDKINKPYVKDIACHIPKYMTQNGEVVVVVDSTGSRQAAYVVARAICELESKSIYEVFMEIKNLMPDFEIGRAYL